MLQPSEIESIKNTLTEKKRELRARLDRINNNVRRPLDADSKERAKELEDQEVVDALGVESRLELKKIDAALEAMERGEYGRCKRCGAQINSERLLALAFAENCIECAERAERESHFG